MRLLLSLPVLVVALLMILEGPAPAQAETTVLEKIMGKMSTLKENVEETVKTAIHKIKEKDIPKKTWTWVSDTFRKTKEKLKNAFSS